MTLGATVPDEEHAKAPDGFTTGSLDPASTIAITTQVLREQLDAASLLEILPRAAAMLLSTSCEAWLLQVGPDGRCRSVPNGRDSDRRRDREPSELDEHVKHTVVLAATRTRVAHEPRQEPDRSAVIAVPLLLRSEREGQRVVLTLTSRTGFSEADLTAAAVLGVHVSAVYDALQAETRAMHLETALESSRTIGIAIGILTSRYGLSQDDAFDVLKRLSQDQNRKLRDLAEDIVQGRL